MSYAITIPDREYFDKNIPCQNACPIHTECGRYVQAIGISRDEEAYLLARAPNPFRLRAGPNLRSSMRRQLPPRQDRRAHRHLRAEALCDGPAQSRAPATTLRAKALPPAPRRNKRIAVVGAGVCGLTCAHDLALLGYTVEVFESAPVPGGMLYLGIPQFRLPREIIKMEVDNILVHGRHAAYPCDNRSGHFLRRSAHKVRCGAAGHRV